MDESLPLAYRMRPQTIDEFVGQEHLLVQNSPLRRAIENHSVHSMILWGPPGCGKTTLANLLVHNAKANFKTISAVSGTVKEIREIIEFAKAEKETFQKKTVLFVDEVHRFNKAQQDVFLPYIEDGTIFFIGATTENPSFEINKALLSRVRVYILKRLSPNDLKKMLDFALTNEERGLGTKHLKVSDEIKNHIITASGGDARTTLNILELAADLAVNSNNEINVETLKLLIKDDLLTFDKKGEYFYDLISVLHKSVRGSNPDAALFWFSKMLVSGCDPLYLARRIVRMAIEDVALADPNALTVALNAYNTFERLGSPEGELALANAVIYLACASKSNRTYVAFNLAKTDAKKYKDAEVPLKFRNAESALMKAAGYGKNYRYAHDEENAYVPNENYFPAVMPANTKYYVPTNRGFEIKITDKLNFLKSLDDRHKKETKQN